MTVSWSEPSDGGSAITDYDVRYIESSYIGCANCGVLPWVNWQSSTVSTSRSTTITGLTNGTSYAVVVRAKNSMGSGDWSDDGWGTPAASATVPGKVGTPSVSAGDGSLTVSWSAPSDGGSAITGYEVWYRPSTSSGSYTALNTTATSITIPGLTNGTGYTVFVRAQNAEGTGEWSDAAYGTPISGASVPNKPALPSVVAGNRSLTVSWNPPADGGSAITLYEVSYRPDTSSQSRIHRTTETTATLWSLTNGTAYTVFVRAQNAQGFSNWSDRASGTPQSETSVPAKSPRPYAEAGDRSLRVSWSPPADGGSAITGYEVRYSPSTSSQSLIRPTSSTSLTLTGLINGTMYRVHVRARNSVGVGEWSDEQQGIPAALVGAPGPPRDVVLVAHGENRLRASWSAPASTGGSAVDHYLVKFSRGSLRDHPIHGYTGPWSKKPLKVKGTVAFADELLAGVWHRVWVTAVNSGGHSPTVTADGYTPQAPEEKPSKLGRVEITNMQQLGGSLFGSLWDHEDAVRIEWNKVSGATGYEVAYWFRQPYGDKIQDNPETLYKDERHPDVITVEDLAERGILVCEAWTVEKAQQWLDNARKNKNRKDKDLPCPATPDPVEGADTTEYETEQLAEAKIPALLEVAVRAVNSNTDPETKGDWSEYYSLPARDCNATSIDLGVVGMAAMIAELANLIGRLFKIMVELVLFAVGVINRMLNNCESFQTAVANGIIDSVPFMRELLDAFAKTKCDLRHFGILETWRNGQGWPADKPFIMCGDLYDIDGKYDQNPKKYPLN